MEATDAEVDAAMTCVVRDAHDNRALFWRGWIYEGRGRKFEIYGALIAPPAFEGEAPRGVRAWITRGYVPTEGLRDWVVYVIPIGAVLARSAPDCRIGPTEINDLTDPEAHAIAVKSYRAEALL